MLIDDSTALKRLNYLTLAWGINTLAFSIVYPFLPIYLHSIRGLPMSTVGIIFLVMGLASIIGSPLAGYLVDRFGRRVVMLYGPVIRSISFFSLSFLAYINAPFIAFAIGLFFTSLTGSFFQNGANTYVIDLIASEDRTVAISRVSVGANIGWMLGPAIGAYLAQTPYALLFGLTASFCLITPVIIYKFCTPIPVITKKGEIEQHAKSLLSVLRKDHLFLALIGFSFFLFMSSSQFISTLSVYCIDIIGIDKSQLGMLYTINGAVVIVFLIKTNQLLKNIPNFIRIGCGAFIYVIAFLGYGMSENYTHLIISLIIMTFGEILAMAAIIAEVGKMAPENMVGRYMGIHGLSRGIALALGPYIGFLLFERLADQPLFLWQSLSSLAFLGGCGLILTHFLKLKNNISIITDK